MIDKLVICSETIQPVGICPCPKCDSVRIMMNILTEAPEDGTDQARLFDSAIAHLIFPEEGEGFEDILNNAQK
jgi:hypothetical protein